MLRKFFLFLIASIGIAPLWGVECCSNCLGSGFLVGGYGTFHIFVFHTKDQVFNDGTDEEFWEYDAFQRAPGGGGFVGYGIPFCEWFNLAFKVAATGLASDAQYSFFDDNTTLSFTNKMRAQYVVDLSLEPGTKIGKRLLMYVKFGASYVGLKQTRQILDEDIPNQSVGDEKHTFHNWGYVFGAGCNTLITRCISAFVEFDGHSYPINKSKQQVDNTTTPTDFLESRLTRLYGYGFRFGLMAQF